MSQLDLHPLSHRRLCPRASLHRSRSNYIDPRHSHSRSRSCSTVSPFPYTSILHLLPHLTSNNNNNNDNLPYQQSHLLLQRALHLPTPLPPLQQLQPRLPIPAEPL